MKIIFHGGTNEVGRSCIEVESKDGRFIMDAGIKLSEDGTKYPTEVKNPETVDAVFIGHAHLDHTGALPLLDHQGLHCPIYATSMTKKLSRVLLEDAYKIGKMKHTDLGYTEEDVREVLSVFKKIKKNTEGSVGKAEYKFYDAGHIPGSTSIKLMVEDMDIVYTSDINTIPTRLLDPANTNWGNVDVFITESTYGNRQHPPRKSVEKDFLKRIRQTVRNGGTVLIPTFAVGRAQELLLLLAEEDWGVPVYMDGMGVKVTKLCLSESRSVKDIGKLRKAFKKVHPIKNYKERKRAVAQQSIILTTSGMLTGGPVISYLKYLHGDSKNAVLLTGYQAEGTNGRLLKEHGYVFLDGVKTKVKCELGDFDFSAHVGQDEIKDMIRKAKPKHLVLLHGEPESMQIMREWAEALDIIVHTPTLGESIEVMK